jgi:Holliday junction DNA helicase RuvA
MFNSITGTVTAKSEEQVCLEAGPVEWELATTAQTLASLPEAGKPARLYTYLHHREDVLRLYGFATRSEREVFLELIKVDGVGPRLALRILSGVSADDFVAAVQREDIVALTALPGLGQKTAQKVLLKLRGHLPVASGDRAGSVEEILAALTAMGFDRKEAQEALEAVRREEDLTSLAGEELERELLRQCMRYMGGRRQT